MQIIYLNKELAFAAGSYLNHSVLKDTGASLSTIASIAPGQNGTVGFATTHWSMVVTAQGDSPEADRALERLCRTYWWPIYSFIRRQGSGPEDAKDLTQSFFALLFERRDLEAVRREKGRLRSFFFASLKNFLAKERRYAAAAKRGEGRMPIPLDELLARKRADLEPADTLSADRVFERRWSLTVLEQVLARLEDEYLAAGNAELFQQLKKLLTSDGQRRSHAQIGRQFGMTENAVNQAFYRLRGRYRELLHEEIAQTVIAPDDTEDELRHLIAVLRP